MAKISGEPGKISLKVCSGTGIEEFKQKFSLTNFEVAAFLRDLAQEIESGGRLKYPMVACLFRSSHIPHQA